MVMKATNRSNATANESAPIAASTERCADYKRPPPRGVFGDHATNEKAEHAATGGNHAVDAERDSPLVRSRERCRQE